MTTLLCKDPDHDVGCLSPCPNPNARCEYCDKPAVDERKDRGRRMDVCEECAHEHDVAAELERSEMAYEDAVDRSISEWKDEGKVGMPRPVRRRP